MEVIETNRPRSHVPHLPLGPVGARVNMLLTSTGRAYIGFCSQEERDEIVAILKAGDRPEDVFARDPFWLARLVAQTQAQGYGLRDPLMTGEVPGSLLMPDDGRNSISVPIIVAGQVIAAMNLTWTRRAAAGAQIVNVCLPDLRSAAAEVARGLSV